MEGNFGGGKRWRIWQMTVDSPNLSQPNFIQLKKSHVIKFICAIMLVDFEVLQL